MKSKVSSNGQNMLKSNTLQLDLMISNGQMVEAIEAFFDDHVLVKSSFFSNNTQTKAETKEQLADFMANVEKINNIQLVDTAFSDDNRTMSEFVFDFTMKDGSHIVRDEIISRRWADDLVVSENYFHQNRGETIFTSQSFSTPMP